MHADTFGQTSHKFDFYFPTPVQRSSVRPSITARGVNRYALTQPPTVCALRELCDIGDIGKLTREQFALALHLINQKLTKGVDPPPSLSPEMIPPSDRQNMKQVNRDKGSSEGRGARFIIYSLLNYFTFHPHHMCYQMTLCECLLG